MINALINQLLHFAPQALVRPHSVNIVIVIAALGHSCVHTKKFSAEPRISLTVRQPWAQYSLRGRNRREHTSKERDFRLRFIPGVHRSPN